MAWGCYSIGLLARWTTREFIRLSVITQAVVNNNASPSLSYDADGERVLQAAPGNYKTVYSGNYEETFTPTLMLNETFPRGASSG